MSKIVIPVLNSIYLGIIVYLTFEKIISRQMNTWLKNTIGIIVSLIILFIAGALLFRHVLFKSIPEYEGTKDLDNLSSTIEIYRDRYAIPYIFAGNQQDAAFALGYCHAQERMFQMDLSRRAAYGRLSEVFGAQTVTFDMMFRTIGMERTVKRELAQTDPEFMVQLKAYSAGVNAYIKEAKGKYPIEFDVLGYEPEEWKPEHSLIIGKMLGWQMNISWWTDVAFAHLAERFSEEKIRQIVPEYPADAPVIVPGGSASPLTGLAETDRAFRSFIGYTGTHIGSNNWAVSPQRSASGKAIIANDPHLPFQAPCTWYAAVIRSNGWNCEGLTIPGLPLIIIGKNQHISWTVTNVMADDADFYTEKIDSSGRNYFFNGQWQPLKRYDYTIAVKDSEAVNFTVKETHRGPVISNVHLLDKVLFKRRIQSKSVLSMRWTGNDPSAGFVSIFRVNKAGNWSEFRNALRNYSLPGQNFVYADDKGNIGYQCAAKLPIRAIVSSTFVCSGESDQYDWKGYVPYEQMPSFFNPDSGFIATANNRTVSNYKYYISNIWEPSSRIERITEMLKGRARHSVADFRRYQMDFTSPYARTVTPYIISAFQNVRVKDKNLRTALYLLKNWNSEMGQYSQVPAIYEVFFQHLIKNIFLDEMGSTLFNEYNFIPSIPYNTVLRMLRENNSSWFDNIKTPQRETRDDIIRKSLSQALSYLEQSLGTSPGDWQWSKLHSVTFKHLFHGRYSFIDRIVDIGPYSIGGSGTTVFNTEYFFYRPYENVLGPSMRFIFDFARPDHFDMILTTGQSGNVLSPHYKDMTQMWLSGKYISVPLDERTIKNSNYKLLILN